MTDFPGYTVVRALGAGGMGQVVLAQDDALGRRVAIKTLTPALTASPDARQRFRREARTLAAVDHPGIVQVFSYGEAAGVAYLVMEYVEGESLAERMARGGALSAAESLRLTREIATALAAAARRGVIHRDVKPANVLLDGDGHVRVADFGLARSVERHAADSGSTTAGTILGSPHYMSPEQARGLDLDVRTDMYALGIVLYEMLRGTRPFSGENAMDVMVAHLTQPLPALPAPQGTHEAIAAALLASLTAKDREARPRSWDDVLAQLDGTATSDRPTLTAARPAAAPSAPAPPRRLMALAAGFALIVGGTAVTRRAAPLRPANAVAIAVAATIHQRSAIRQEGRRNARARSAEAGTKMTAACTTPFDATSPRRFFTSGSR